ncbi:MAG: hypothetical protein ACP5HU_03805 [Phycisphaerae bacterium]
MEALEKAGASRIEIARQRAVDIANMLEKYRPDHVFALSSEAAFAVWGLARRRWPVPSGTELETIFLTDKTTSWSDRPIRYLRDRLWWRAVRKSPCTRMLFLAFRSYLWAKRHVPLRERSSVEFIPDPALEPEIDLGVDEARSILGIPTDGTYIGLAGCLDRRKNLEPFLDAFFSVPRLAHVRVLLGGRLADEYAHFPQKYRAQIESGQLILRTGYLDEREYQAVQTSLDAMVLLYNQENWMSSGLILQAARTRKYVLTNRSGWAGYATRRFGLGVCVEDLRAETINAGIEELMSLLSRPYQHSELARRWLELCSPEWFTAILTNRLRERLGHETFRLPQGWESIFWDGGAAWDE